MDPLQGLMASDTRQTLQFFYSMLNGVAHDKEFQEVSRDETLYVASILAHFAQVSTSVGKGDYLPVAKSWNDLDDNYRASLRRLPDSETMEDLAAQSLLLAGFFRPHVVRSRMLADCYRLGQRLYALAYQGRYGRRAVLLESVWYHYPVLALLIHRAKQSQEEDRLVIRQAYSAFVPPSA